eukprot:7919777-Heterocapsa_arctica.AAC.1
MTASNVSPRGRLPSSFPIEVRRSKKGERGAKRGADRSPMGSPLRRGAMGGACPCERRRPGGVRSQGSNN